MEALVDIIVDSNIPTNEIVDLIKMEIERRKEIDSMKERVSFRIYDILSKVDCYWELCLTEGENAIKVISDDDIDLSFLGEYTEYGDGVIYELNNAEEVLNEFLYLDSLSISPLVHISVDKISPVI